MNEALNNDASDLAAARAGDHEAFARLYDRHAPVVLSLCRQATGGSLGEAEDILQETFIRAHRLLPRLDDASRLRPWLYSIARHVGSERRRAAGRRTRHEAAVMLNSTIHRNSALTAVESAQRAEEFACLTKAIERLGDRERLAVHLYYLEADPLRAAATALGLSRSGYYKLLTRARTRLAHLMRDLQTS